MRLSHGSSAEPRQTYRQVASYIVTFEGARISYYQLHHPSKISLVSPREHEPSEVRAVRYAVEMASDLGAGSGGMEGGGVGGGGFAGGMAICRD